MDIIRLLQDYNIPFQTEGHKHCRPGWVNMSCCFCTGNPGMHLGNNLDTGQWYCWRCGWHPTNITLAKLLNISASDVKILIRQYKGQSKIASQNKKIKIKPHKLPSDCREMGVRHRRYLEKRNFDPDKIEKMWGVLGTGPVSLLDGINYSHRVLAPISWQGQPVSFQARDITEKHKVKYLACPKHREEILHQNILYGRSDKWGDSIICVEGITDVWRFGYKAVGVFGIDYSLSQLRWLCKLFNRIFIAFDDDPQAIVRAKKLQADILFRGKEAKIVPITGDPGNLPQTEANALIREIFRV